VTAISYCSLLALEADEFDKLLAEDPDLKVAIDAVARRRLGALDRQDS
jgi:CRP-like cAMP-binding protein